MISTPCFNGSSSPRLIDELKLNGWESIDTAFNDLRIPFVKHFAQLDSNSMVLDVGCGTGMLLRSLPGSYKVGVDFAPKHIDDLHLYYNMEVRCGNFLDIEFDQKFDTVIGFSVLQYIDSEKVDQFIKKALSIATKSVCFFDVPNADKITEHQSIDPSQTNIQFYHKDFFHKFSNDVTIQDWNMPFCRFNHVRYNVKINL